MSPRQPLELWGGIECTTNRVGDHFFSQLRRGGHWDRLEDLDRIAECGIRTLRYPLLWEELAPGHVEDIDWKWADARMERLRSLGIRPIVGFIHHGSGPRGTSLIDPHFPEKLAHYARAIAERYPWLEQWTPINEPLTTARFSGLYGHWYPHGRDAHTFARCLLGQMRATVLAMRAIREVNPAAQLVQTEDLGEVTATPRAQAQADFENERRWLTFDLLTGKLNRLGDVARWLNSAGISERELASFEEVPCPPDLIGINHYITSSRYLDEDVQAYPQEQHGGNGAIRYADIEAVRARPEGLCEPKQLLHAAWERYGIPLAITEAHLSCTREEQMRWFSEIWNVAHAARRAGVPVAAVTAWSLFGAYDWNSLLTRSDGHYEPGAWDLRSPTPRPTALARMLTTLATGSVVKEPAIFAEPGWWRRRIRLLHMAQNEDAAPLPRTGLAPNLGTAEDAGRVLLITGATGTLGQAFARICHRRGLPFRLLSRAAMDIADAASVRMALRTYQPWAIVNAAGFVRVDDAERDRFLCMRENAAGPAVLASACREHGCALLTFSSHLVFNGEKITPYVESDPVAPLNVYGQSKADAESRVAALNPAALIVRTSTFFGPWDRWNFIAGALEKMRAGEPVRAAEDALISPTYVLDLVHTALDLLIDRERGIWHLANTGTVSWADFARAAARLTGVDASLVHGCEQESLGLSAKRPLFSVLGSERAALMPAWEGALARCLSRFDEEYQSDEPEIDLRDECVA